jgi:hypothetical protein
MVIESGFDRTGAVKMLMRTICLLFRLRDQADEGPTYGLFVEVQHRQRAINMRSLSSGFLAHSGLCW